MTVSREQIQDIVAALGGAGNIAAAEPCVTRLRFEVHDVDRVQLSQLRQPLCYGATLVGSAVQVIVGPQADILIDEVADIIGVEHPGEQ